MQTRHVLERQMMRCGLLPPVAPERLVLDKDGNARAFMHNGVRRDYRTMPALDASTCAGYASKLPEVIEVVLAYPQWKGGTLTEWIGEPPSPVLLTCLAMIDAGKNQCESDRIERERIAREAPPHGR